MTQTPKVKKFLLKLCWTDDTKGEKRSGGTLDGRPSFVQTFHARPLGSPKHSLIGMRGRQLFGKRCFDSVSRLYMS